MKIDKNSLRQSRHPQQQAKKHAAEEHENYTDGLSGASHDRTDAALQANQSVVGTPSRRSHQIFRRSSQPRLFVAFITLLVLAFAAGVLIARLALSSSQQPGIAFSPLVPTIIPLTPIPRPTATAPSFSSDDALETLYIDISPPAMEKIKAKRKEALQLGILLASGADYVPGAVRLGRDEIPMEMRLKGDWVDHIAHDKWSFRVRTVGDNYLWGMRTFSLHDPSRRSFLDEWLFLENQSSEDVLGVGYRFVRVVLNGEYKGIYALEEGFSKELLESQQRREGVIIRYDEDLVWEYRAFYDDQLIPRGVNQFYIIDEFQSGQINSSPTLSDQRDVAVGMLRALWNGERTAAEIFDLKKMGDFLALSDLWSAPHGLIWHNLRYYYNPITTRLEPIAFDSDALTGELDMAGLPQDAFYHDPYLQAAYVQALWRISQPGYVEALELELGGQFEALRAALEPEFGIDVLEPPWELLRRRQSLIRQTLNPYQTVYAYVQQPSPQSLTLIDAGNLLELPVEIVGFEVNGTLVPAKRSWVDAESADLLAPAPPSDPDALILLPLAPDATSMGYVRMQIPTSEFPNTAIENVEIVTRLWGLSEQHRGNVLPDYPAPKVQGPMPELPTVDQALAQHPFLNQDINEQMLYAEAGTWIVNGDLILPAGYGLRLSPGTTLRFGHDSFLLANGPLDFQGTEDAPILLQPFPTKLSDNSTDSTGGEYAATDQWQGVVVLGADSPSTWNYVTVERASSINQDGWNLTGGVTFYESPIRLGHSRILGSRAEDGINTIRTEFEFVNCEFADSVSDAFDADFGRGTITDCSFHDIGGDGIDVGGSDVAVQRVKLLNIGDKGISVGENSRLEARDVHFENIGIGMASKDLSHATLDNATIIDAQVAGLAAYSKKADYGPASLIATGIRFSGIPQERYALVQTGSWIELEGQHIEGSDIDVDALYQQ